MTTNRPPLTFTLTLVAADHVDHLGRTPQDRLRDLCRLAESAYGLRVCEDEGTAPHDPAQKWVDGHPDVYTQIGACPLCGCSHPIGSWSYCHRHRLRWRTKSPANRTCAPVIERYHITTGVYPTAESVAAFEAYTKIMDEPTAQGSDNGNRSDRTLER